MKSICKSIYNYNIIFILAVISFILCGGCAKNETALPHQSPPDYYVTPDAHVTQDSYATPDNYKTPCGDVTASPQNTLSSASPSQTPAEPSDNKILKGMKICIDPGHQKKGNSEKEKFAPWSDTLKAKCTYGATGLFSGNYEYVLNLQIAEKIRVKLETLGASVLMTREIHDVDISNLERAKMANDFGADITLRIHCNSAGASSASAEGIELYVRGDGDGTKAYKEKSDKDYGMAEKMIKYICAETDAKTRGVFRSDAYTGINWCENTCIIIECGFLSNEKEDRLLNTPDYQEKIADGIKNYFISTTK